MVFEMISHLRTVSAAGRRDVRREHTVCLLCSIHLERKLADSDLRFGTDDDFSAATCFFESLAYKASCRRQNFPLQ